MDDLITQPHVIIGGYRMDQNRWRTTGDSARHPTVKDGNGSLVAMKTPAIGLQGDISCDRDDVYFSITFRFMPSK